MRIAYVYDVVYPYVVGGVQKRIWEVSRRLVQRGHEVTIFGMKHWDGNAVLDRDGVKLWGICRPLPLFIDGHRSTREAFQVAWRVLPVLSQHRYDVIDCQNFPYFPCLSSGIVATMRRCPLVITWHEVWDDYWDQYLGRRAFLGRAVERLATRIADVNATGTNYNRSRLLSLGIGDNKVSLVPIGGVSMAEIEQWPCVSAPVDVIFVGRLIKAKGVDTLLKAIAILRGKGMQATLVVVGDGPERQHLEAVSQALGIRNSVKFLGEIEDDRTVISLMKASRVFVYPVCPEGGWSISVVEANACGVPVVSVRSGALGINEVVEDGRNGLLVEEESADGIAEAVYRLLTREELRAKLGQNGAAFAKQQDWDNIASKMEDFYRVVCDTTAQ